jgi:hypothetical protein
MSSAAKSQTIAFHEAIEIDYNIYPNPTSGILNVKIAAGDFKYLHLEVKTASGKTLLKDKISQSGVHSINMRLLQPGMYYLHLFSEDGAIDQRTAFNKI